MDENKVKIAHLRDLERSKQCDLRFWLTITHQKYGNIDQEIKSLRQTQDSVASLLAHTKNKIVKLFQDIGKAEVKIDELDAEMDISLTRNDEEFPNATTCFQLLQYRRKIKFKIFGVTYKVIVNAPLIHTMMLPKFIYVNANVRPTQLKGIHFDKRLSKYTWSKSKEKENWTDIFYEFDYDIIPEDLNHYLKLTCCPLSKYGIAGPSIEVISENIVGILPELPTSSMKYRNKYIGKKLSGKSIRVVSYNTLAERYTDNQFVYCDPGFLSFGYRKQLIINEIINYKADIICLQEIDYDHYNDYFKALFKNNDYIPVFYKKGRIIPEGLSFIYDRNRFKQIDCKHIVLSHEIKKDLYKNIWGLIRKKKEAKELFLKQHTSLLVATLELLETNDILIVANTHLYYHREAGHIRVLQIAVALRFIKQLCQSIKAKEARKISVIFCGDFNSRPDTAVYHFLTEGNLKTCTEDLNSIGGCKSNVYQHGFNFQSACGTPEFTNYTEDFKGCLDYIFCQKDIQILQTLPFPPEEELSKNVALPNQNFPSDHIALVADLML